MSINSASFSVLPVCVAQVIMMQRTFTAGMKDLKHSPQSTSKRSAAANREGHTDHRRSSRGINKSKTEMHPSVPIAQCACTDIVKGFRREANTNKLGS